MAATQTPATEALAAQLTTKGADSKKYRMTMAGIIAVTAIFLVAGGVQVFAKDAQVLSLATAAITAVAALVGAYTGAQAWVDARTTTALAP